MFFSVKLADGPRARPPAHRAVYPASRLLRHFCCDGLVGIDRTPAQTDGRASLAVAEQSRRRARGHSFGPHSLSDDGSRACTRCERARDWAVERGARPRFY